MYSTINGTIEKYSKLFEWSLFKVIIPIGGLPTVITTIFNYCVLDLGSDSFILPCPMMLPSIWKTPIGYAIVMLDIVLGDAFSILCAIPTICFCLGSGWFLMSFAEDITNDLRHLNVNKKPRLPDDRRELRLKFCKIIQLYTDVKELSDMFKRRKMSF